MVLVKHTTLDIHFLSARKTMPRETSRIKERDKSINNLKGASSSLISRAHTAVK